MTQPDTLPISTALFDLDGTVLDTIDLILASYEHVHHQSLSEFPYDPDHYRSRLGVPLWGVFGEWVGDDQEKVGRLVDEYRAHNRQKHDAMVTAFDGMPELLGGLRDQGIRTAIVTSKMGEAAERGLRCVGLEDAFDALISVDDVTHHKPHPEPVVKALFKLGSQPAESIFIGDAPADIGAGRAAGVRTGAVLWGPFSRGELEPHAPHHWFDHPSEILSVFRSE